MAINHAVQAEVIDIRADRPKPTDVFLVDTNVWLWMKSMAVTIGAATTDTALARLSSQHLDGHDLFLLQAMTRANVTQLLTGHRGPQVRRRLRTPACRQHVTGIPQCPLIIRHSVVERPEPRGVTPRRLAAAERVLARERQRLALFVSQVLAEQETPEGRIRRIDADNLRHDEAFRDLAAKHWREGRRLLRLLPPDLQAEVLEAWNRSSIPPTAAYFVDFVRTQLRRWRKSAGERAM